MPDEPDTERTFLVNFSGEFVATPLQPATVEHSFDVAYSVVDVRVNLHWSLAADEMSFALLDPKGKEAATSVKDRDTSAELVLGRVPSAGTWKLVVTSTRAIKDAYAITVALRDPIPGVKTLQEAMALASGGFAEVNFVMEGNETIHYEWALRNGGGMARFNVHSHEGGAVQIHATSTGAAGSANFTAPHRGAYSLLWENKGTAETAAEFTMRGAFRLHSQTPRAT